VHPPAQAQANQGLGALVRGLLFTILMTSHPKLERRIADLAQHLELRPALAGIQGALAATTTPIEWAAILLLAGRRLGAERQRALGEEVAQVIVLCLAAGKVQRSQAADHIAQAWSSFSSLGRGHGAPSHDAPCPLTAIPVRRLAELSRPRRCP
jgi:hypothetical protein